MELNEYQNKARENDFCPVIKYDFDYPAIAMAGEVGELLNKIKKIHREGKEIDSKLKEEVLFELGDILWYLAKLCRSFNWELDYVASINLIKIDERLKKGTLWGNGDRR
ncbi:MAG: nucleoside triphosphate pyrophosphohydrolase family protein [Candidatus Woesearchaeota archaeon]